MKKFYATYRITNRKSYGLPSLLLCSTKQGDCTKEPRRDPLCTKTKINQLAVKKTISKPKKNIPKFFSNFFHFSIKQLCCADTTM